MTQASDAKKTNPRVKFSSTADGWRNNHKFTNGSPSNMQAQFFLFKLLKNHFEGQRTFITNSDEVYVDPPSGELVVLQNWFMENIDNFIGQESGMPLSFLANTCNMVSFDRATSNFAANEVGQEWIVDSFFWNR